MLAQKYRLTGREVGRLYKKGRFFKFDFLNVRFLENRKINPRFAVVIPKTVSKKAVVRNRIKRKISAEIFELLKNWGQKKYDIILMVKAQPQEEAIAETLSGVFKRVGSN